MTKALSPLAEIGLLTTKQNEDVRSFLLKVGSDGKSSIIPSRNRNVDDEVILANNCEKRKKKIRKEKRKKKIRKNLTF